MLMDVSIDYRRHYIGLQIYNTLALFSLLAMNCLSTSNWQDLSCFLDSIRFIAKFIKPMKLLLYHCSSHIEYRFWCIALKLWRWNEKTKICWYFWYFPEETGIVFIFQYMSEFLFSSFLLYFSNKIVDCHLFFPRNRILDFIREK